jgi:chemotaxis protein methyltransferase CheR
MNEARGAGQGAGSRPLTGPEFQQIRRLAHEKFGLDLRQGKEELVSARLGRQMREARFRTFEEYYRNVLEDSTGAALTAMIDALTTNFTSFFREGAHFEFLRKSVLPAPGGRIRIWSAACATGEEPYTIAIAALEELGGAAPTRVQILATDISTRALAAARAGIYHADHCEGIPDALASRYLLRGSQGRRRVKDAVRRMVDFQRLNLIEPFDRLGPFRTIFCRNVMIYFDGPTRESLVNRLAAVLEPGGWLLTGHAESLTGLHHPLAYVKPAVYRKRVGGRE